MHAPISKTSGLLVECLGKLRWTAFPRDCSQPQNSPFSKCCLQEFHAIIDNQAENWCARPELRHHCTESSKEEVAGKPSLETRIKADSSQVTHLHNLVPHLLTQYCCCARLSQPGGPAQQRRLLLIICVALSPPPAPAPAAASPLLATLGGPGTWRLQVAALPSEQPFS
jgi:hypothetical protein